MSRPSWKCAANRAWPQGLDALGLLPLRLGAVHQAVGGEGVGSGLDALEGVDQAVVRGHGAHLVEHRLGLDRPAELGLEEFAVGLARSRRVRVEEEGQPVDAHVEVGARDLELGQCAVQAHLAEEAPWADEVGNEVDVEDHLEACGFRCMAG